MDNPIFLNGEGGFCFISHSFHDFKKVREIRNILEENGINPLCFFLKCMTDEDEIDGMLRREIEAREIFILADSENSRKSKAVQKEIEIVTGLGRSYYTINLDNNESPQALAETIMRRMRVFISYSYKDAQIAYRIYNAMLHTDLRVFLNQNENYSNTNMFIDETFNTLREAAQYGCVLALQTEDTLHSPNVAFEIGMATALNAKVLLVIAGNADYVPFDLLSIRSVRISVPPTDAELKHLCDCVQNLLRS